MSIPQLFMRHPDIASAERLALPEGIMLCTHTEGNEAEWEELIERAFGTYYSFDKVIRNGGDYSPERVLYLRYNGKAVATVTAVEKDDFKGEGWFRMVAVDPDIRGRGLGKLITLEALKLLAERGYKTAVLSTDDERLAAINLYYSIGFRPLITHDGHEERWEKLMPHIKHKNK